MTPIARVRAALEKMPPAERQVAALVLDDPRAFVTWPVARIAERAGVSKPTVVRFCRRIGYDGLAEFKLKLAGSASRGGVPFVHRAVDEGDGAGEIMVKVIDNAMGAILKYRDGASGLRFEQAIAALEHSIQAGGRIGFFGVGNSGIVAQDAQHKFFRLRCNAVAYVDGHVQVMAATMLGADDCAVIISNSGRSRDLLDVAELARRSGATTIGITASGSPLARMVGILLAADHPEGYDRYSPMVSRLLHLVIVDILTTGTALRLGPQLRPLLAEIKKNLRERRYREAA